MLTVPSSGLPMGSWLAIEGWPRLGTTGRSARPSWFFSLVV
ncbi:hypothetical protein [Limnothrix sp. FACHB-881]|nr:hypothetical protein [Limnothrix sp. FACHB-881]